MSPKAGGQYEIDWLVFHPPLILGVAQTQIAA